MRGEESMSSEGVEASLLRLIKTLNSGVIYLLDKCYITPALSFDILAQVLYTGIALFLSGQLLPRIHKLIQ